MTASEQTLLLAAAAVVLAGTLVAWIVLWARRDRGGR